MRGALLVLGAFGFIHASAFAAPKPPEIPGYDATFIAMQRCLSRLNIWPREVLVIMAEMRIKSNPAAHRGLKDAVSNGMTSAQNAMIEKDPMLKDCKNTVVTHLATAFPSESASMFMFALHKEGWFDEKTEVGKTGRLPTNLYILCKTKYKHLCGLESGK